MQKEATINPSDSWEPAKTYEISKYHSYKPISISFAYLTVDRKLIPCYVNFTMDKQFTYIVEDPENLIIISPELHNDEWARILKNVKLKKVEVSIDKTEPRTLNVLYVELKVIFPFI